MISYCGQAIVSFSSRVGDLLGIQSRRIDIELEETSPKSLQPYLWIVKLEDSEEVRITLPERQYIYGRVSAQEDQVVTIVSTRLVNDLSRSAPAVR
ncbi:hypothetical protein [Pseudomonas tohonis]|uniref:Uncharacterized protein n=1 Tax=Pseudomonas tohonis TaxID=2725477 RepID=A0ABQ4WAF2_9PSED|nr:hypothetical protein [Pseudomonas tohonis]GJN56434.1 hypothetical protein TUM20286_61860 [Pseudomonas tohonis]